MENGSRENITVYSFFFFLSLSGITTSSLSLFLFFIIVLNFLGLNELVFLLSLDGPLKRSVMVSVSVVADEGSKEGLV